MTEIKLVSADELEGNKPDPELELQEGFPAYFDKNGQISIAQMVAIDCTPPEIEKDLSQASAYNLKQDGLFKQFWVMGILQCLQDQLGMGNNDWIENAGDCENNHNVTFAKELLVETARMASEFLTENQSLLLPSNHCEAYTSWNDDEAEIGRSLFYAGFDFIVDVLSYTPDSDSQDDFNGFMDGSWAFPNPQYATFELGEEENLGSTLWLRAICFDKPLMRYDKESHTLELKGVEKRSE